MDCIEPNRGVIENPQSGKVSELNSKSYRYFEDGDVIFAKVTPCMENGNCAIADGLVNGIGFGSTEFYVFRTTQALHNIYLWYYLRQQALKDEAKKTMTGAGGLKRVPKSFFERTYIPIPKALNEQYSSVALQRVIVEFIEFHAQRHEHNLSKINRAGAMWNKIESLVLPLTFAKEKSAARRFNIFCQKNGYELTLEEVEFEVKRIHSDNKDELVCKKRMGFTPTRDSTGNINWYTVGDLSKSTSFHIKEPDTKEKTTIKLVKNKVSEKSEKFTPIQRGDVLISFKLTVGVTKVYESDEIAYCNEAIDILTPYPDKILSEYLAYICSIEYPKYGIRTNNGMTLNDDSKKSIEIKLPMTTTNFNSLDIQKIFITFFKMYFNKTTTSKDKVALLNHLIPHYNQTFITTTFNAMKRQAQ